MSYPPFKNNRLCRLCCGALFLFATTHMLYSEPLAHGAGKFLGNITSRSKSPVETKFADYWNQVTPENEGKWGVVERTRNTMSWANLDSSYQFAKRNNFPFKLHTFIWGSQEPSWIGSLSKEEQLAEVKEWMRLVAERYPDVEYIDVVNEPSSHPASFREALGGSGETGWDWIIWSFKEARALFPKAKLLINEYNVVNSTDLTDGMAFLANLLKERGLIDGIGIQSHYFSWPLTTPAVVMRNLNVLAQTGVPIYSTEFDATGNDSVQLAAYTAFFPLIWEHPGVAGVTLWGWMQDNTWETNTYLLSRTGVERPAFTWLKEYMATHKDVVAVTTRASTTSLPKTASISRMHNQLRFSPALDGYYTIALSTIAGRVVSAGSKHFYGKTGGTILLPTCAAGTYILSVTDQPGNTIAAQRVIIQE